MPIHAMSRYNNVTERVIDACQQDYWAGLPANYSVPHISLADARVIVAESLEADALLVLDPRELAARLRAPASDWTLLCAYEVISALAEEGEVAGKATAEQLDTLDQLGFSLLEQVLDSPVASPLVWYDEVFDEVIQEYVVARDRHAIDLRFRQLAHLLRFDADAAGRDINLRFVLRDLGEAFLYLGEYERGVALFTALVRNDPTDVWVYNALAFAAGDLGWPRLGAEAARRGLALLAAVGDPEELHDQLTEQLEHLEAGSEVDRQDELPVTAVADLRAALTTDFVPGPHQPPAALARLLVPELADAFVKQPAAAHVLPPVHSRALRTKLGRNDPCWCGSGRKYKQCHMAEDRAKTP